MFDSTQRARYETQLAIAHKAIWRAQQIAGDASEDGIEDDLGQYLREITRMTEDSLKGKRRTVPQGQMAIEVP